MKNKIKVLIADDYDLIRQGLKMHFSSEKNIIVVGEARNRREAIEMAIKHQPDILLLEINMPELNGIEVLRELENEKINVLILSMHDDVEYIVEAVEFGCKGYLLKNTPATTIIDAIKVVSKGRHYFADNILQVYLNSRVSNRKQIGSKDQLIKRLTIREIEVTNLVAQGLTGKEIAANLFISSKTVTVHKTNIFRKLNIKNSVTLVRIVAENNIYFGLE